MKWLDDLFKRLKPTGGQPATPVKPAPAPVSPARREQPAAAAAAPEPSGLAQGDRPEISPMSQRMLDVIRARMREFSGGHAGIPVEHQAILIQELTRFSEILAMPCLDEDGYYWQYFKDLHPMTKGMVGGCIPWRWGYAFYRGLEIAPQSANRVFQSWGYPVKDSSAEPLTDVEAQLADRYRDEHPRLWAQYLTERDYLDRVKAQQDAMNAFREHSKALSPTVRALLGYEMARIGASVDQSGFHSMSAPEIDVPFWACSWANTEPVNGVAFAINRECFTGRDPLLFFIEREIGNDETLADRQGNPGWAGEIWQTIEGYSSGLRDVELNGECILFRLDPDHIKHLEVLYGGTDQQEDYVFTWPGAGEFWCTLGEIIDGKLIPLYRDDFAMK